MARFAIQRKYALYRRSVSNFSDRRKQKYTTYRNKLNNMITKVRRDYFREKLGLTLIMSRNMGRDQYFIEDKK